MFAEVPRRAGRHSVPGNLHLVVEVTLGRVRDLAGRGVEGLVGIHGCGSYQSRLYGFADQPADPAGLEPVPRVPKTTGSVQAMRHFNQANPD